MAEIGVGLRWAIEACRSAERSPADIFSQGGRCSEEDLARFIPVEALEDLDERQLIVRCHGTAQLTVTCHNFNNLVSVMPTHQDVDADFVHLNGDTFRLLKLIWKHGASGNYAVELGTGNGIVAAHMVARYKRVLATDLNGPWLHYARLTLAANAGRGRPSTVVASDVASALRPGQFDLVAANSPWSPAVPADDEGREVTFMAGGPTGTELPERFLRESAALLAPGGVSITLCFDPIFEDGSRPLMPILDELRSDFEVECVDSEVWEPELITERLQANRLPNLAYGRHLAVITRRPIHL